MTARLEIPDLMWELEQLLRQIPPGRVTSFGTLARTLGDVGAARWVAQTVRGGNLSQDCPVHRVVKKSGELGNREPAAQRRPLLAEGVAVKDDQVEMGRFGFEDFESPAPLARLKQRQDNLPAEVEFSPFPDTPEEIAAVDLSYLNDGTAVACYAVVETGTGKLTWSASVHRPVTFPYISGYLAYRELPILLDLMEHVQSQRAVTEVLFVDGNGKLHPRRAGIASHLGVLTDLRTVGVGKKLLCGKVELSKVEPQKPQPIWDGQEELGQAMKAEAHSRPVFVSPGHRIHVADAARLAGLLFHGHRLPEPIYYADALSRREAQAIMSPADKAADRSLPPL